MTSFNITKEVEELDAELAEACEKEAFVRTHELNLLSIIYCFVIFESADGLKEKVTGKYQHWGDLQQELRAINGHSLLPAHCTNAGSGVDL